MIEGEKLTREGVLEECVRRSDEKDVKNVSFIVGKLLGADTQKYILSKFLMRLASAEFESLISGEEHVFGIAGSCIYITDVEPSAFESIVQHIYVQSEWKFDGNYVHAFNLLQAARKFQLLELSSMVSEQVPLFSLNKDSYVDFGTACNILNELKLRGDKDLREVVLEYLCKNGKLFLEHESFLQLSSVAMCALLSKDQLCVRSELDVFKALVRWGLARCKRYSRRVTPGNFQELMQAPIRLIRFLSMSDFEFQEYVLPIKVLTHHQEQQLTDHRLLTESTSPRSSKRARNDSETILNDTPRQYERSEPCKDEDKVALAELYRTTFDLKAENWSLNLALMTMKKRQDYLENCWKQVELKLNERKHVEEARPIEHCNILEESRNPPPVSQEPPERATSSVHEPVVTIDNARTLLYDMKKTNACVVEITNGVSKMTNGFFYCYSNTRNYHSILREIHCGRKATFSFCGTSKVSCVFSYRLQNTLLVVSFCLREANGDVWVGFLDGNVEVNKATFDKLRSDSTWHQKPDYKHVRSSVPDDGLYLCVQKGGFYITVSTTVSTQAAMYINVLPYRKTGTV